MPTLSAASPARRIETALCGVVLAAMLLAVVYAGWISLINYSRIGV